MVLAATRLKNTPKYRGLAVIQDSGPNWTGDVRMDYPDLLKPFQWTRPRMAFVNAMSDLFHPKLSDYQIDLVVATMWLAGRHIFQVLTKRPDRMAAYLSDSARPAGVQAAARAILRGDIGNGRAAFSWVNPAWDWPLPNVWWGASMGHQAAVAEFMPHLVACRPHATVLWVSAEPLTEAIDLKPWLYRDLALSEIPGQALNDGCSEGIELKADRPDWVVGGGESGRNARPCPLTAARQLRDQCLVAGVDFHFKQWGEWCPVTPSVAGGDFYTLHDGQQTILALFGDDVQGEGIHMVGRVRKSMAGRMLDGVIWDACPGAGMPF